MKRIFLSKKKPYGKLPDESNLRPVIVKKKKDLLVIEAMFEFDDFRNKRNGFCPSDGIETFFALAA